MPPTNLRAAQSRRPRRAALAEAVADRAHRLDQVGVLFAELGAQTTDVNVDRARTAVVLVAPHPRQQLLAVNTLPGWVTKNFSSSYSMYVRSSGLPRDRGLVRLEVEDEITVRRDFGLNRRGRRGTSGAAAALRAPSGGTARGRSRRTVLRGVRARAAARPRSTTRSIRPRESPLRNVRHSANAPSGSSSAHTTAPIQPSAGSSCIATAALATDFQREARQVERLREQGRRRIRKDQQDLVQSCSPRAWFVSCLQRRKVAGDLERRDIGLVVGPLPRLLTRKFSNTCSPSASATSSDRSIASSASRSEPGSESMPSASRSASVSA